MLKKVSFMPVHVFSGQNDFVLLNERAPIFWFF